MILIAPETSFKYFSATLVRITPFPLRIKSFFPMNFPRLAIWWLTADGVIFRCSAAALILSVFAASRKDWIFLSERSGRFFCHALSWCTPQDNKLCAESG